MPALVTARNRLLFIVCTLITGAVAGAAVWAFFRLMGIGINLLWGTLPAWVGHVLEPYVPGISSGPFGCLPYPLTLCVIGGICIGLFERRHGPYPEDLNVVMGKVKAEGRYPYDKLGSMSVAALLPLVFGGSVGPEAGLTGVIAGLCTWVGDRLKRFGSDFRSLTTVGVQAALTAVFTAPFYGFVAPLCGTSDDLPEEATFVFPKSQKAVVYLCAIAGALGAFVGLGQLLGGGAGLPHFSDISVGKLELAWFIPLAIAGMACGWLYHLGVRCSKGVSAVLGARPVVKAVLAGLILAVFGMVLPFAMFAGEAQTEMVMDSYVSLGATALLATGFVKAFVTPVCINLGWRGGHFFSGVCLGFGFALLTGADPTFCTAACTSAVMGAVMRQPLMAALLLFMCFPLKGVVVMLVAAIIGSAVPLPRVLRGEGD